MSDRLEPIRRAFRNAGLYHHAADDLLCGQLADAAASPAALAEPLFLLHTGTVYGKERGDWEIEANSGKAVDAYCDANPGKTVGLYLATQAQQPAALAVPATNVTPMRQPRADLARLVESIKAAVYVNGDGLSVTEAIGALELAKLELLKEQEQ